MEPKGAKSGEALPFARVESINSVPDVDAPKELDTHNLMEWGQFLGHNITHTVLLSSRVSTKAPLGMKQLLPPIFLFLFLSYIKFFFGKFVRPFFLLRVTF